MQDLPLSGDWESMLYKSDFYDIIESAMGL